MKITFFKIKNWGKNREMMFKKITPEDRETLLKEVQRYFGKLQVRNLELYAEFTQYLKKKGIDILPYHIIIQKDGTKKTAYLIVKLDNGVEFVYPHWEITTSISLDLYDQTEPHDHKVENLIRIMGALREKATYSAKAIIKNYSS